MADPLQVCEAIVERLTPVMLEWHLRLTEPSAALRTVPPLPYALVEIVPTKGADYVQADSDWTKWFAQIVLNVDATDPEASLRFLAPWVGTKGPIHQALKDTMCDYNDALTQLSSNGVVQPTTLSGFRIVRKYRNLVRTATIAVTVGAN